MMINFDWVGSIGYLRKISERNRSVLSITPYANIFQNADIVYHLLWVSHPNIIMVAILLINPKSFLKCCSMP